MVEALSATDIPSVGMKPSATYKAGSWDTIPSTTTAITGNTTYTYTYAAKEAISATVTFKVVNGSWEDGTTADKTVTLSGLEGETLKLSATDIPSVGTKPGATYKTGSWDAAPSTTSAITGTVTYTYTYAAKDTISATVTFKVANGTWEDGTTTDKTVTLSGLEGDTLKLSETDIPSVETKLGTNYMVGSWDITPSTTAAITGTVTYTYTYAEKLAAEVTAPTAKTLTYNGTRQELVNAGSTVGGTMLYALGKNADTAPADQLYSTSISDAVDAGTYYVWYKVAGDENHYDTEAKCVTVEIETRIILGDVNGDGVVDVGDALMIARYDARMAELDQDQLLLADINGDGGVNIADALYIMRLDAGLL